MLKCDFVTNCLVWLQTAAGCGVFAKQTGCLVLTAHGVAIGRRGGEDTAQFCCGLAKLRKYQPQNYKKTYVMWLLLWDRPKTSTSIVFLVENYLGQTWHTSSYVNSMCPFCKCRTNIHSVMTIFEPQKLAREESSSLPRGVVECRGKSDRLSV